MHEVYVVGAAQTCFQRWPERDFRSLAAEVCEAVLADAGPQAGADIDGIWFANCAMGAWGQVLLVRVRPQVCGWRLGVARGWCLSRWRGTAMRLGAAALRKGRFHLLILIV